MRMMQRIFVDRVRQNIIFNDSSENTGGTAASGNTVSSDHRVEIKFCFNYLQQFSDSLMLFLSVFYFVFQKNNLRV